MADENKYVEMAERIARTINMELVENVPEFKKLFSDYNDAYCELSKTMDTQRAKHTLERLTVAVKKHLNHTMLREIFALIHPKHKDAFFYLNKEYLMGDSEIKRRAEEIRACYPPECYDACYGFIKCYKKLITFYEKEMHLRASRFINECYKYYC